MPGHPETGSERKEACLVGLVLVSHSEQLVEGLGAIVAQFGGTDVPLALAGGTDDGRIGTTAPRIESAIRSILDGGSEGALVLLDFGSALLSSAMRRWSRARFSPALPPAPVRRSPRSRKPPAAGSRCRSSRRPER
jgi:hypothetical protein